MRVLYLSPTASMGGAERVLLDLLGIVRRAAPGWTVGLIVANEGPLAEAARQLGVVTTVLPFPRGLARIGDAGLKGPVSWAKLAALAAAGSASTLTYVRRFRRAIADFAPDLIHSNGFKMHLLGAIARPDRAGLIWHFHDYLATRRVAGQLVKRLKHRCSLIVAVSNSVAADLRAELGEGVEIRTIWNTVDLARFHPDGPRLDLDRMAGLPPATPETIRVGLVATFARWKGHLLFLDVMRALLATHNVRGYVVGGPLYETDGSQYTMEELRAAAARLGIERSIGFTGFVPDSAPALRALDIVVHASVAAEPFGLVIAEAMAAGRPVVVSASGGVVEPVSAEQNALTYPTGDPAGMARQLGRLIEDVDLRHRLGRAAREAAVVQFDQERLRQEMFGLYARFDRAAAA